MLISTSQIYDLTTVEYNYIKFGKLIINVL